MGNLSTTALTDLDVALTKDILPKLATKANSSVLGKFERKIGEEGVVGKKRGFTLFISNQDIDDFIKILKSLEDSGLLTDGAPETVKLEIKNNAIAYEFIDTICDFFTDKCFI